MGVDPVREAFFLGLVEGFPAWAMAVFVVLTFAAFGAHIYISYAYGSVVATLAIIEDTSPASDIETDFIVDDESAGALPAYRDSMDSEAEVDILPASASAQQQEQLLIASKPMQPITSSMRGTLKHVQRAASSKLAPMRAFRVFYLYNTIASFLGVSMGQLFGDRPFFVIPGVILGETAFAWLNMVRVHMVISKPRALWFWQRAHFRKKMRQILFPTFVWSISRTVPIVAMMNFAFWLFPFTNLRETPTEEESSGSAIAATFLFIAKAAMLLVFALALILFIYIPAKIILARCQAALLSEDETPIVPFDRTFQGRVRPDGSLSMRNAWRSFDMNGRVRVARIYLYTLGMLVASWSAYLFCILVLSLLTTRSIKNREGQEL